MTLIFLTGLVSGAAIVAGLCEVVIGRLRLDLDLARAEADASHADCLAWAHDYAELQDELFRALPLPKEPRR